MKSLLSQTLLLLSLFWLMVSCFAKRNNPQQELIKVAALKQDFDILRTTLEQAHPGLYWYSDTLALDTYFDRTKALIDHDLTRTEFFKILLPVIANIRCSHTSLRLPANPRAVGNLFTQMLPFDLFFQNGRLYIQKGYSTNTYNGMEILSINRVPAQKIVETILNSIPSDGFNQTFKYHLLNKGAFREGYALYFGQPDSFTIEALDTGNGKLHSFTSKSISPKEISTNTAAPRQPFQLRFHQNTAILAVNTFDGSTSQFQDGISKVFKEITEQGAKHLIIDLRQNGGGINDNVSTLYSYLATAPFRHLKRAEMKTVPLTYPQFISKGRNLSEFPKDSSSNGVYVVNRKYAGTQIKTPAQKGVFKGEVLLLVSGYTTSAASEFVAIARYLKRAKIVGEETGGCYYGATGGNYLTLTLPNSGLEVRVPTIKVLTAVEEDYQHQPKGRGVMPDYPVSPTIKDVIKGEDVQLKAAITILSK